jgi:hypothetical protein
MGVVGHFIPGKETTYPRAGLDGCKKNFRFI